MTQPASPDALAHPPADPVETLGRGRWLELKREGRWEYVSRTTRRGAAFILALTDDAEIVFVEQYRTAIKGRCIELPAGIIGDEHGLEDEPIAAAAGRELEEETGYRAAFVEHLLTGPTAGGMSCEQLHLMLATGLTRVHDGGGVEGEDIRVHVVPLAGVDAWLYARMDEGLMVEPRIYAALRFAERHLAGLPLRRR